MRTSKEEEIISIQADVYKTHSGNRAVNDQVWNYVSNVIWILHLFDYEWTLDRWIILLKKLVNKEISFDEFCKTKEKEIRHIDKKIKEYIKGKWDLSEEDTQEIKKYLNNL